MKLTKEYIRECLDRECEFNGTLSEDTYYDFIVLPLKNSNCFHGVDWTYDAGATKMVLIFSGYNFVVKIPFNGVDLQGEGYFYDNEEGTSIGWTEAHSDNCRTRENVSFIEGDWEFYNFENAECDGGWDYCEVETLKYVAAEAVGVEELFAKTEFIGYVGDCDHPIYIQERCVPFREETSTGSKEKHEKRTEEDYKTVKEFREESGGCYWLNEDWLLDALNFFGKSFLSKFSYFCDTEDIGDLHNGNIGYKNGIPCIFDYSNYHECY